VKKIGILVLSLLLLQPAPAEALFNRDCSNLKKRVSANQVKFEKSWDKYQTALGRYQALRNPPYGADQEVANRLRVTWVSIETILIDMAKFPKCLSVPIQTVNQNLADVRVKKSEYVSFRYGAPLAETYDFRTYLK
jgi:hypothetical protein